MAEDTSQPASTDSVVSTWLSEIDRAQRTAGQRKWAERCEKIRKKYRYETSTTTGKRKYQMLWSNMETMKPSVYTKLPKGVVQRRWRDKDRVARTAAEMLERGVNYTLDANHFHDMFEQVRDDYLLYARGVARIKYKPEFDTVDNNPIEGQDAGAVNPQVVAVQDAVGAEPQEVLKFENVVVEYVQRPDFVHSVSRTWGELDWQAFRAFMDRKALVKRFGKEVGEAIPLTAGPDRPDTSDRSANSAGQPDDKGEIWEIWDKRERKVLWIAKGYPRVLDEGEPYLKLEGFFPAPRPAYGTLTNDSLDPVPDYVFYQDQCEEIDTLTARIGSLSESLKVVGFYPSGPNGEGSPEIERAVAPGFENRLIAVKSWAMFTEAGKGGAPIVWLPVDQVAKVLEGCVKLRQQLIEDVYQIYGLSDIMRGDGNAQETATAQQIKAQFGSIRIRERQNELARFCRDICQLVGEVIASHFQPETLMKMANMPLPTRQELAQQQLMAQIQAMRAQALAQQTPMMGHNGGPPMGMPMQQTQALPPGVTLQ